MQLKNLHKHKLKLSTITPTGDVDYQPQSAVPLDSESHGGDDIPILASGPMSHLFHSVHQQSYIAHVTRFAFLHRITIIISF